MRQQTRTPHKRARFRLGGRPNNHTVPGIVHRGHGKNNRTLKENGPPYFCIRHSLSLFVISLLFASVPTFCFLLFRLASVSASFRLGYYYQWIMTMAGSLGKQLVCAIERSINGGGLSLFIDRGSDKHRIGESSTITKGNAPRTVANRCIFRVTLV